MNSVHDISVLIATCNRAQDLEQTLAKMRGVRQAGLKLQLVVIDNNSTDNTRDVAESYRSHLPLHYLFESRPGKNCALNHALDTLSLGRIVVFTDDDVSPPADWLCEIVASAERWPNHRVFGGAISVEFPEGDIPAWCEDPWIQTYCFGRTIFEETEGPLAEGVPNGANYWVRRNIFDEGHRFDESVGPRPTNRIMGSETSLLSKLRHSEELVYAPRVRLGHRIQKNQLTAKGIRRKSFWYGRGRRRILGAPQKGLLRRWPLLWLICRIYDLTACALAFVLTQLDFSSTRRVRAMTQPIWQFAFHWESLRIFFFKKLNI